MEVNSILFWIIILIAIVMFGILFYILGTLMSDIEKGFIEEEREFKELNRNDD